MVNAATLILAASVVVPALAAPHHSVREVAPINDIEARDPKFSFGKFIKGAVKGVGKVAGMFLREDVEELDMREFEESELEVREDAEDMDLFLRDFEFEEMDAREPKFSFGKLIKGAVKGVGKVAGMFLREDAEEISELAARELEVYDELD